MLAVRIRPLAEDPAPEGAGWTQERRGSLSACYQVASPYGFAVSWERGWILGERVGDAGGTDEDRLREVAAEGADLVLPDAVLGLVVVDAVARRVVVAASVRGARPTYLHVDAGKVTIATSLDALRALGVALEADEDRFPEVLVYRFVAPPNTLCRGVRQLVAGETVVVDLEGGEPPRSRLPEFPDPDRDASHVEVEDLAVLRAGLLADIGLETRGRARPGAMLSGGLDSSLLTALARLAHPDLGTWSSSFQFLETSDEETAYARTMADALGVRHRESEGSPEAFLEAVVRGTHAAEAPLHHIQSAMLHLLFQEAAAAGHDLLLCGEGADSLFGTTVQEKLWKYRHLIPWIGPLGISAAVRKGLELTHRESERWSWFALGFGRDIEDRHHLLWTLGAWGDPPRVQEAFGVDRAAILGGRQQLYATYRHLRLAQQVSVSGLLLEASATTRIWSRLAQSSGVALACPFTDPQVVDRVVHMPLGLRLLEPKHLVRALLRAEGVPASLVDRPKLSFGLPYRHWALPGALFQPLVDLAGATFDPALLRALQTERPGEAMILWSAVSLHLWKTLVVDRADPDAVVEDVLARHRASPTPGPTP